MKTIATSDALDLYCRITEFNDYSVLCAKSSMGNTQCFMTTTSTLAEQTAKEYTEAHEAAFFKDTVHEVVQSRWCDIRKKSIPSEYIVYNWNRNEILPIADITTLELFIASLAMSTSGFIENNVMDHDVAIRYREYFDEASRMDKGEVHEMTMETEEARFNIFRCVINSIDSPPKIVGSRCPLTK